MDNFSHIQIFNYFFFVDLIYLFIINENKMAKKYFSYSAFIICFILSVLFYSISSCIDDDIYKNDNLESIIHSDFNILTEGNKLIYDLNLNELDEINNDSLNYILKHLKKNDNQCKIISFNKINGNDDVIYYDVEMIYEISYNESLVINMYFMNIDNFIFYKKIDSHAISNKLRYNYSFLKLYNENEYTYGGFLYFNLYNDEIQKNQFIQIPITIIGKFDIHNESMIFNILL